MRLKNFAKTDEFIESWMADKSNTSSVAHNMFSDMSEDERFPKVSKTYPEDRENNLMKENIPERGFNQSVTPLNWASLGYVTPPQGNGYCFGGEDISPVL
jgi:6-phosphogluconolactonase/glucosamine-6-phosphate isomerase/deaminase